MKVAEMCSSLIEQSDVQKQEIAAAINKSPSSLSNRLKRNSLSAEEFVKIIKTLGFEIAIKNPKTGEEVHTYRRGIGKRLKMSIKGVMYDTYRADAICHSDEKNETFIELYRDREGRYFVAQYNCWQGGKCTISTIDNAAANAMKEKYKDTIVDTKGL